ncbi:MAG: acyl-ACP thioesterase [Spirochaetaceae bacterium]|jgi:acyl-ACP thioesterase|nr:acyl-ACP thioesterase [Spirochaetaceae bacterium]
MKAVWQEDFPVRWRDVDRAGRLTLASTMEVFQEAAISHAEELGAGRAVMLADRQGWVLSRMSVVMDARPRWGDGLTVRTWPRGTDRLFAVRDYDIMAGGGAIIRGRSGWLILDLDRRRPLRPQSVVDKMPANEGRDALSGTPAGLEARDGLAKTAERTARYSDIDFNGHMNNTRYISWLQDLAPPELLENAARLRLDVNYLAEVMPGECIELYSGMAALPSGAEHDGAWTEALAVEGRRGGEAVFRAELRAGT